MAKKNILSRTILFLFMVFGVCVSIFAQEQTYPSGKEFFPAVYGTFSEMYPNARFLKIDFYNNSYTVTGVTGSRLGQGTSYDMTVRLTQSGGIETSYANTYGRGGRDSKWEFTNVGTFYNYKNAMSAVVKKILSVANNPNDFDRYEKMAMSDIQFVYTIMNDLTELAYADFIKNYVKDSVFNINGHVSEVSESDKEVNGATYKYLVSLTQRTEAGDDKSSSYLLALRDVSVYCRFYTNRDDVIRLTKTSVMTVQGRLIAVNRSGMGITMNSSSGTGFGLTTGISLDLIDAR